MRLADAEVVDTFAEAFPMWAARIVITAETAGWADTAARSLTGFATSVIGCKCEAGIERELDPPRRPTAGRASARCCSRPDRDGLAKRLVERVGQTVLTCPTTACFSGLEGEETVDVGGQLRFFGDGYQASKVLDGRRYWRVPVMEGEFLVQERFAVAEGVAGGNIIMLGRDAPARCARQRRRPARCAPCGSDHAVPGRDRPQRQQGRLALQRSDGLDQRRAVPDAAGAGARHRGARGRRARCSRSSSTG